MDDGEVEKNSAQCCDLSFFSCLAKFSSILLKYVEIEAYCCGWKACQRSGNTDPAAMREAGNDSRRRCLGELRKAGIPVAQDFILPN